MSNKPTTLEQFRSFCYQNRAEDFVKSIEYFAVFGGMGWSVDIGIPIDELIVKKVLSNYKYIHGDTTKITQSNPIYHSLLTAIATGDRREHSAFKKASVGREQGEEAMDFLIEKDLLVMDKSIEKPLYAKDNNSDKMLFTLPFMRFWFAMISPTYKSIKSGDFSEMMVRWSNNKHEFSKLIYTQLIRDMIYEDIKKEFVGDPIVKVGSYYDKNTEIDIVIKTKSGFSIACTCKYTKAKAKKSDLTTLRDKCKAVELEVDRYIIYSQNGFSSELKKEKSDNLKLLSVRNLSKIMDDLNRDDLIESTNKRY